MKLVSVGVLMMWVLAFGGAGCGGTDDGSAQSGPDQIDVAPSPALESPGTVHAACDCPTNSCDYSECYAGCGDDAYCQNFCSYAEHLCMIAAAQAQIMCMRNCISQGGQ